MTTSCLPAQATRDTNDGLVYLRLSTSRLRQEQARLPPYLTAAREYVLAKRRSPCACKKRCSMAFAGDWCAAMTFTPAARHGLAARLYDKRLCYGWGWWVMIGAGEIGILTDARGSPAECHGRPWEMRRCQARQPAANMPRRAPLRPEQFQVSHGRARGLAEMLISRAGNTMIALDIWDIVASRLSHHYFSTLTHYIVIYYAQNKNRESYELLDIRNAIPNEK